MLPAVGIKFLVKLQTRHLLPIKLILKSRIHEMPLKVLDVVISAELEFMHCTHRTLITKRQ